MLAKRSALDLNQARFHIVDGRNRAAHGVNLGQFVARAVLQGLDPRINHRIAVEKIVVFQQIGLESQDLLHPQRPLLVPGARQAEGLVPGRKLNRARAGVF